MRPLTEDETRNVFEKLSKFIDPATITTLITRPDTPYVFRLHKDRVYYVSEEIMRKASNVSRDELVSLGTCLGKFTKSGRFRLGITALDYLAMYGKAKMWLRPSAEQQYLYGHNVLKSGLGRISESVNKYQGVVLYSMGDIPLGFGVAAKSTFECKSADPGTIVCFHQADLGQYVREEDTII